MKTGGDALVMMDPKLHVAQLPGGFADSNLPVILHCVAQLCPTVFLGSSTTCEHYNRDLQILLLALARFHLTYVSIPEGSRTSKRPIVHSNHSYIKEQPSSLFATKVAGSRLS